MRATLNRTTQIAAIAFVFISLVISKNAFAVFINFDDLTPIYPDPDIHFFGDNPLSDQYLSQGLSIGGGAWLNGEDGQNHMTIGSGSASLYFEGALPTYVSLEVTSLNHDAIFLNAFDSSGLFSSKRTAGWVGPFVESTPYIPNELVSFSSELGISQINMSGFFNLRAEATIDNITFTYASIPEPSPLALMGLGLFAMLWRTARARYALSSQAI